MATKTKPPEAEAPELPTEEPTISEPSEEKPPEGQVEPEPQEEAPAAPVQEAEEKPSIADQIATMPKEEQDALLRERFQDRFEAAEQRGRDRARSDFTEVQRQQVKSNQDLQGLMTTLSGESDAAKQAQAIQNYAHNVAQGHVKQRDGQWRNTVDDSLRKAFNLSEGEYRAAWIPVHEAAAKENREANPGDFIKHKLGDGYMLKTETTNTIREEMKALRAEMLGQTFENQAENAPVSVGGGETVPTKSIEQRWVDEGSPQTGPLADEYREWRKTLPQI